MRTIKLSPTIYNFVTIKSITCKHHPTAQTRTESKVGSAPLNPPPQLKMRLAPNRPDLLRSPSTESYRSGFVIAF